MIVHFLAATNGTPLTKSFSRETNGHIIAENYPHVREFTSYSHDATTLEDLHEQIVTHAELGRCLLKGKLNRELKNESRAGSTNTNDTTNWLVIDADKVQGINNAEEFITQCLPQEFQNTSYIRQTSSSQGILPDASFNEHLFFLLDKNYLAPLLKSWLTQINLTNPTLTKQLGLNSVGTGLKFPLDRTCTQNDKLIYIAPPQLHGDLPAIPLSQRIALVKKTNDYVRPQLDELREELLRQLESNRVSELRLAIGLKKKTTKYKFINNIQVCANPDVQTLSAPPKQERGFTYLSLNGGDSYPYWHPQNNPSILYNWKGEPPVILKDFLPGYWESLAAERRGNEKPEELMYLAFRDFRTAEYFNGIYTATEDDLQLSRAKGKDQLMDFLRQHEQPLPDAIPDWTYNFEPNNLQIVDTKNQKLNKFRPSTYLKNPSSGVTQIPPTIKKIIYSATGSDRESFEHFINWLALLIQKREKIGTSWVIHGCEGTGKGLIYHNILRPILGAQQCAIRQLADFDDQFNDWLETCLLLFVDESRINDSKNTERTINFLKNLVTEKAGKIRRMFVGQVEMPLYTNIIFASNNYDAMHISATDRRFNIAARQEIPLQITQEEIRSIESELADFTGYLLDYEVDETRARGALMNQAKLDMRQASQNSTNQFIDAIRTGQLEYFAQYLDEQPGLQVAHLHGDFEKAIRRWISEANQPNSRVLRSEMLAVYCYLQGSKDMSLNKFTRMLAHHNLITVQLQHGDLRPYGTLTTWHATPEQLANWTKDNVISIKKAG